MNGAALRAKLKEHIGLIIAGAAAFSISTMFSAMKPVLLTRFVEEEGYSQSLAGLAVAMPFISTAMSAIALPFIIERFSPRVATVTSAVGLVAFLLGNVFWLEAPGLVLMGQWLIGLFGGVLMGLVSRAIALTKRPDSLFGIVDMIGVLMMSAMIALIGAAVEWSGLRGGFTMAFGLAAVFAGMMIFARRDMGETLAAARSQAEHVQAPQPPVLAASGWRPILAILMGVLFVTFSGLGFAFMFTAARALGFDYDTAGSQIGAILFLSAFACLAGGWTSARFGCRIPLLIAFAACAFGWTLALNTESQIIFLAALVPAIFALQFCFPILLAVAGSMDRNGQWAAIAAPLISSGFAWAALVGGFIVDQWGIAAIPPATIFGMIVCAGLLLAFDGGTPSMNGRLDIKEAKKSGLA